MTVEVTPPGVACNLACTYCYQHNLRDAGNFRVPFDLEAVKNTLGTYNQSFALFGGEALLTPKKDLEALLDYGYQRHGKNSLQTNGALIDDDHIRMFKDYNVNVGFSFDGWGELNDLRWSGSLVSTRENTEKTLANLQRCLKEGIKCSVILTLHKVNVGTEKRYQEFKKVLKWLDEIGVKSIRLHDLEVDNWLTAKTHVLEPERLKEVFLDLAEYAEEIPSLTIDIFKDIKNLLRGNDRSVTCTWAACDPYTTEAVQGIQGDGNKANCGRTTKEGVNYLKGSTNGFERNVALYQIPQEYGGCQGCEFFALCKGQCPGDAIDGDWRQKSTSCGLWKSLFAHFEKEMLENGETPVSRRDDRLLIETAMVNSWQDGKNMRVADAIKDAERNTRPIQLPVVPEVLNAARA